MFDITLKCGTRLSLEDFEAASLTAKATGLTPRRIRNWANRYGWAKEMKPNA